MNVGITYDLRDDYLWLGFSAEEAAEFDSIVTIDAIENALQSLGHVTTRIGHILNLNARLAAGERWDIVFNIAEGLHGLAREAQVPALLDAFDIPYTFSDGVVLALTLHKGLTKHVVRDLGVATPNFAVVQDSAELESVSLGWPVFAKPVAGGSSMGISHRSKINNMDELAPVCRDLWDRFHQPVLIERFLPGREFTVGVIGTGVKAKALGVMEVVLLKSAEADVYSYSNKAEYATRVAYKLVAGKLAADAMRLALLVWTELDCRDAGRIDLRCDRDGAINLLEINPLAGLHPEHSDLIILSRMLGIKYVELISMIMQSAEERLLTAGSRAVSGRAKASSRGVAAS